MKHLLLIAIATLVTVGCGCSQEKGKATAEEQGWNKKVTTPVEGADAQIPMATPNSELKYNPNSNLAAPGSKTK